MEREVVGYSIVKREAGGYRAIFMISIVIPALNEEKLLPDCLDSLRNQDYEGEFEIIIADNGSTDKTVEIAHSFGARVVLCSGKKGVSFARQAGADAARGDIIAQADGDSVYPPGWLTRISGWFASHPEAVAVTGRFAYRDPPWWWRFEYCARHNLNRIQAKLSGKPLLVSGATFAFRKKAFMAAGGYRGLTYSPDQYGIAERLSRLGKVRYDSGLRILTSARTVRKPLFVILRDVLVHLCRLLAHIAEPDAPQKQPARLSRRFVTRLLPVPVAVILIVGVHGCIVPSSQVFGQIYYEGNTSQQTVALTFDDGFSEAYASEILDVLDEYGVKATFFISGENAALHPQIARRIVSENHTIGNQSYYRDSFHAITQYTADDLGNAQEIIFGTVGVYPHLYRPPNSAKTPWELDDAGKLAMIPVTWGVAVDGKTEEADVGEIIDEIEPGEIIRLHDDSKEASEVDNGYPVARLLPQIIEQLQVRGYKLVTVPELLDVPAYNQAIK